MAAANIETPGTEIKWSKRPLVLFRNRFYTGGEFGAAARHLDCRRDDNAFFRDEEALTDRLVIGRFAIMPKPGKSFVEDALYYNRLEALLRRHGSRLVNTYAMHRWIASFEYYHHIKDFTFETWFDITELPDDGTQFVVKGRTHGRKETWQTRMFARSKDEAMHMALELGADPSIGAQGGLVYRRFTELVTYRHSGNGFPFTNEWRVFLYKEHILSCGYLWTWSPPSWQEARLNEAGLELIRKIAGICAPHVNFFVMDVAEKPDGDWIVVELNDGQASGTTQGHDFDELYSTLRNCLAHEQAESHPKG